MPNKTLYSLIAIMVFSTPVLGQPATTNAIFKWVNQKRNAGTATETVHIFSAKANTPSLARQLKKWQTLSSGTHTISRAKALYKTQPASISISIPYLQKNFQLELIKEPISAGGLNAGTLTGKGSRKRAAPVKAAHYRGYINNNPTSVASLSVFGNGTIMALFSDDTGNYTLGKTREGTYILFNDQDMLQSPPFECGINEMPVAENETTNTHNQVNSTQGASIVCKKVRIYWEANYRLYNDRFNNNFTNTVNYLSGLFNQMATLYFNEGIVTELSEVNIWTTQDTFTITSSATGLSAIKNRWNASGDNYNGNLCMLIDGGSNNNGGRAYLLDNAICYRPFTYGYSNVWANYNVLPAYSWDVEVLAHETGHNMGSNHTQWCGWNTGAGGACGAIDNCVAVEANGSCTTCTATTFTQPPPVGFAGTIMSYCHLRSGIGINFSNGFGPLPAAQIRSIVGNASCFTKGSTWTGLLGTAWENAGNWSCGTVPDSNTDVTIPAGLVNYPIINSAAVCRRLIQEQGSIVNVNPAFSLLVSGSQ